MRSLLFIALLFIIARAFALDAYHLQPHAQTTGAGIFLDDIAMATNGTLPHVRIDESPRFGQAITLTRKQIEQILARTPGTAFTNCIGAAQVRVTRRTRLLEEQELKLLLTSELQRVVIKERGDLELRFARPWLTARVPDEFLNLKIIELPATGLSSLFICRFELSVGTESVGSWQVSLNAKVWRDVWVSHAPLRRGTLLSEANLFREPRDVCSVREALADSASVDSSIETAEYIAPNVPLLARSIKPKAVVRRGQSAEAMILDGVLAISLKVEVLEDGIPGQVIRVRNPQSRRELRGKVQNEQTILVSL